MTSLQNSVPESFSSPEVAFFEENGYLVVPGLLDETTRQKMIARTEEDLAKLVEPIEYEAELDYPGSPDSIDSPGGKTVRRLKMAHERDPVFLEFLRRPLVRNRLSQLLGEKISMPTVHHNCIMTKHPDYSSDTGWHQDIRYWRFKKPELVTLWLALGEEFEENGALRVIPHTHYLDFTEGRFDDMMFLNDLHPENQELLKRSMCVTLSPGDALFFHCRTLHSASRNYSDKPKYSAVFTFCQSDNHSLPGTRSSSLPEVELSIDQSD